MKINLDLSSTTLALVLLTSVTMSEAISVKRLTSRELSSSRRDHYSRDVTLPSQTAIKNSARSILQIRADSDSEDATDSSGNGSNVDDSNGGEEDEECSDDEGDGDTSGSANQTGPGSDDDGDEEEECEDGEEETYNQDESGGGEADDEVCEDEGSSGGNATTDDESSSSGGDTEDQGSADSGNSDDREDSGSSSDEDSSSTASTSANSAPTSTKHSNSKAKASATSTSTSHGSGSGSGSSSGIVAAVKDLVGTTRNGQGTFFTPDTGACGWPNTEQDYIVAISHSLYDKYTKNGNPNNNSLCGRQIKATYQGKSVTATIADRCEGCSEWDLDFTPAAFKQLAPESVGRMDIKWQFTGK